LVFHFSCVYLVLFLTYWTSNNGVPWVNYESFKIIENGGIQQTIYNFVLVCHRKKKLTQPSLWSLSYSTVKILTIS